MPIMLMVFIDCNTNSCNKYINPGPYLAALLKTFIKSFNRTMHKQFHNFQKTPFDWLFFQFYILNIHTV